MESTVWRFLIRIDAQLPQAVLTGWLRHRPPARPGPGRMGRVVNAVDGKVLRGAKLPDGRQVHLLSAYDTATGLVLAQVVITAKSIEIPAFTPLLDQVQAQLGSLAGTIIVADALHAQVGHAHAVHARGGHLMVTLGEDAHRARTGNGPAVAAVLRHTAIGYHRSNGEPNIARATRRANRRPHELINAVTRTSRRR